MIRKAVIPSAGFGTRFLPAAKSQPKEMLPIVDTPVIQYVVEEAAAAGMTDILIITGKGKRALEDHFDRNFELEAELSSKAKKEALDQIRRISELADVHFIRQKELKGLGDAILCARHHIGGEPFAVLLGDTIIDSPSSVLDQLRKVFAEHGGPVVALEKVPREKIGRYGVVDAKALGKNVYQIQELVEKPDPASAPSDLAVAGRYILTPEIFDELANLSPGRNDEIQLSDAMTAIAGRGNMFGFCFEGTRYDIGNKLDFLKTNVEFGLRHPDFGPAFEAYLRSLLA